MVFCNSKIIGRRKCLIKLLILILLKHQIFNIKRILKLNFIFHLGCFNCSFTSSAGTEAVVAEVTGKEERLPCLCRILGYCLKCFLSNLTCPIQSSIRCCCLMQVSNLMHSSYCEGYFNFETATNWKCSAIRFTELGQQRSRGP